jgi:Zn-dependent protease
MSISWKLGRVFDIDVYLHPTFLLIFLFSGVLSGGPVTLFLTLAVFGCVLLHEFGHALMARRFGIQTADITIYPIGGVARLTRVPRAPGAELLIALAGPAVNFALIAGLLGLAAVLPGFDEESTLGVIVSGLLTINLVLGLFNLIPAFPMDGGRVLRALLSGWLGRVRATSIAAGIGRALAVIFGVYSLLTFSFIQVALAVFIYLAASAEEAQVESDDRSRRFGGRDDGDGVWVAPPGYRWVNAGNGVWRLTPIVIPVVPPGRNAYPWR